MKLNNTKTVRGLVDMDKDINQFLFWIGLTTGLMFYSLLYYKYVLSKTNTGDTK